MNGIVLGTVGAYFAVLLGVAWYCSRHESLEAYFVNARKTTLWLLTLANVATVVGAGATVAIVSEVYRSGISYGSALVVSFIVGMLLLGAVATRIKAIGDRYGAYTIVDFYHKRFGERNRALVAILQVLLLVIWIGVQTIALAAMAQALIGVPYLAAVGLSVGVTVLYTAIGGLKLDIITDFLQFWIIAIVFALMGAFGYARLTGGITGLLASLPPGHLDPFAFGGVGWFVGAMVLSGFIYLANTAHWQRIFSAADERTARRSFVYALPILVVLGALVLFFGLLAAATLGQVPPDTAFYALIGQTLPPVLVGLGFAAILAVVMSSIDSLVVGGSAILYPLLEGRGSGRRHVRHARLLTAAFGIIGGLVALLFPSIINLSLFVSYLALIFVPSIMAGLYGSRTSPQASFLSILIPTALLVALYPFLTKNTFLITTPLSVAIVLFYDRFR